MAKTYAEQLDDVQDAIDAIEGGAQSSSMAGRTLQRGDLGLLYAERKRLERLIRRESAGGIRVRGGTKVDYR